MSFKLNSSDIVLSSDSYVQIGWWCHICSLSSQLILCKEIANVKQKTISSQLTKGSLGLPLVFGTCDWSSKTRSFFWLIPCASLFIFLFSSCHQNAPVASVVPNVLPGASFLLVLFYKCCWLWGFFHGLECGGSSWNKVHSYSLQQQKLNYVLRNVK